MLGKSFDAPLRDEDFNKKSSYDQTYKFVRKVPDPRFGEVSIMGNQSTRDQIMMRERKYNDKNEAGRAINAIRARMANNNPYGLKLLDYSTAKQSELCSTIYIVRQFWELPGVDMRREFSQRQANNQYFTEAELSQIAYNVIKANPAGMHGDISPLNIVMDKATNAPRLIDKSEEPQNPNRIINIQKQKIIGNQPIYQSPNIYSNLKKNNLKFNVDPSKEDAFSLGLTLLELGNLKPVNNIYNAQTKEIDRQALERHIAEFRSRYSPNGFLVSTVEGLSRYDENMRLGMRELEASLPNENEFKSRMASNVYTQSANPGFATQTTTTSTNQMMVQPTTTITNEVKFTAINPTIDMNAPPVAPDKNPFYRPPQFPPVNIDMPPPQQNFVYTPMVQPQEIVTESKTEVIETPPLINNQVHVQSQQYVEEVRANTTPQPTFQTTSQQNYQPVSETAVNYNSAQIQLQPKQIIGGSTYSTSEPQINVTYAAPRSENNNIISSRTYIEYRPLGGTQYATTYSSPQEIVVSSSPISYSQNYITSVNTTPTYVSANTNKIVLEPEVRKSVVVGTLPSQMMTTPSVYTAPSVVYTTPSAPVVYSTGMTETITSSAIPTTSYTTLSTPTYTTISTPTYTTGETITMSSPVTYTSPTYSAPSYTIASPSTTYYPTETITSSTIGGTTTLISDGVPGETTTTGGLRLVRSYQDAKFSTDVKNY